MALAPLLDRRRELSRLHDSLALAAGGEPQLVLVWGRRRVGKTFLLSHFVDGRRAVFFGATQQAQAVELRRLAETVRRDLGEHVADLSGGHFGNWEVALRFFAALAVDEPLTVVLDEVPYLARSTPGFASIVQVVWDHLARPSKLMLVLTGSAVGMIEDMLGAHGALHGRPTQRLRMAPVSLAAAREFLPNLAASSVFEAYAACGGYPLHLSYWDEACSTEENLQQMAGAAGGILRESAEGILREELSAAGGYPQILAAVGRGATRYAQIMNEVDQRIEHPLEVLAAAGFVERTVPVGAPKGARPTYELPDPYLRFWFGVLYNDLALIDAGQGDAVLRRAWPRWQKHLGYVFEASARDHVRRMVAIGDLPPDLVSGRWWSTRGPATEVDVLGLVGRQTYLIGEAKWRAEPLGSRDLARLREKLAHVPEPIAAPKLMMWGRAGITEEVAAEGVLGFTVEDIER